MKKKKVLYIEPFYGGSHQDFTDGYISKSSHEISLYTLPARFWKWRLRGAAFYFADQLKNPEDYDLLFTSDMMSLSDLKMLWGNKCPPAIVYFHENQLSYPLPKGEKMDYQFGFTDITTALAADRLIFNSHFHMNIFLQSIPGFIEKMPEHKPLWITEAIKNKSEVLYPGCNLPPDSGRLDKDLRSPHVPTVVWNHRWEFDKCPKAFFDALSEADTRLKEEGAEIPFNMVLLGENFQKVPHPFAAAEKQYGRRILQFGYCENKAEYFKWLETSDVVISTAIQENFGISIVEAVYSGCFPLLPDRLSYPELVPEKYHSSVLYGSTHDLAEKLTSLLRKIAQEGNTNLPVKELSEHFGKYSWERTVHRYDELISNI